MELKDIVFKSIYYKEDSDIYEEVYRRCMENSVRYDRITGYFGSSVLFVTSSSLRVFLKQNGMVRIICSPVVSNEDYDAIIKGLNNQNNVPKNIEKILDRQLAEIEARYAGRKEVLDLFALLISSNRIQIKFAFYRVGENSEISKLMHDKIGIFTDNNGYSVMTSGSANETYNGMSPFGNLEHLNVDTLSDGEKAKDRIKMSIERFEQMWNDEIKNVPVYNVKDVPIDRIAKYRTGKDMETLLEEIKVDSDIQNQALTRTPKPLIIKLHTYQRDILQNWRNKSRRGILEMATGSGKTFTAISAIQQSIEEYNEIPLIIVPSKLLFEQWEKQLKAVFLDKDYIPLKCGNGHNAWKKSLSRFTSPDFTQKAYVLATIDTASSELFISEIIGSERLFLVIDEVHTSGADKRSNIFKIRSGPRLGLSATPKRYGDPEGTQLIVDYFGGVVEPKFSLIDAIKCGSLVSYYYYPQQIYLTDEEQEKWSKITDEIRKLYAMQKSSSSNSDSQNYLERMKMLIIRRSRIVKKASGKIQLALDVIKTHYEKGQRWIIYCDDIVQAKQVKDVLEKSGYSETLSYYSEMKSDKEATLKTFEIIGGIVVSIKCLDEGVDIPSTSHALILASSQNPREFIQRRGRVLRTNDTMGKKHAFIYDAITVPIPDYVEPDQFNSIIAAELSRAIEFASHAENSVFAETDLKMIANKFNIDYKITSEGGNEDENNGTE